MTDKRIKVLQVITGLANGGAERLVLNLIDEIDSAKFDVRLASVTPDLSALETYNHQGASVEVFDLSGRQCLSELWNMKRYVQEFAPDVVHAHMFHALIATFLVCLPTAKRPSICFTSHNFDQAFPPARAKIVRLTRRFRRTDIVFDEAQHRSLNSRETVVVPNGVPVPDNLAPRRSWERARKVRVIAVGRLSEQKDPLGLIRAISNLEDTRVHLDFFGQGPLEEDCQNLIQKLGLERRIQLRGLSSEIRAEMHKADILAMHSHYEGMPMALLEAGAEAMPVISTPVGSVPKLLADNRGVIAPVDQFSDRLAKLIENPSQGLENGTRLYHYVRDNLTIRNSAQSHEQIYTSHTQ